jgi:hypothetical protein
MTTKEKIKTPRREIFLNFGMRQATTQFRRERLKLAKMPDPILYKNIFYFQKDIRTKTKNFKKSLYNVGELCSYCDVFSE